MSSASMGTNFIELFWNQCKFKVNVPNIIDRNALSGICQILSPVSDSSWVKINLLTINNRQI